MLAKKTCVHKNSTWKNKKNIPHYSHKTGATIVKLNKSPRKTNTIMKSEKEEQKITNKTFPNALIETEMEMSNYTGVN